MNRSLLLIAIAATAVVVIVAGVLLLGDGQSPSLSGALSPTSLTLNISPCTAPDPPPLIGEALNFTFSGSLRDANGGPVPGRTVTFTARGFAPRPPAYIGPSGGAGSAVTAADGSFSLQKQEPPTPNFGTGAYVEFQASFAGDAQYIGSLSNWVRKLC